jgi:tRNA(adenine34) deaminase
MEPAGHYELMGIALDQAREALVHDDVPVGAVVARDGQVIAVGRNRREIDVDPTAHAEILALRAAATAVGSWHLEGCELIVTLEPCAMCAGAVVLSRIDRVVYGASDPKAGAVRSLMTIADDQRLNHRAQVVAGVREEACSQLLTEFFTERRALAKARKAAEG